MRLRLLLLIIVLLALAPASALAQSDTPTDAPPPAARVDGVELVWQQFNRCASAALTMHLSFFDVGVDYTTVINQLNPNPEDVSVRLEEMAAFSAQYGLESVIRTGGTIDTLKALIAAGFPVLVENAYYDGPPAYSNWTSHNRLIVGYDDRAQQVYIFDSVLGSGTDGRGRPMSYTELDTLWRPFNRVYLVLYRPEQAEQVQAALGPQWETAYNAEWTYQQVWAEREQYPDGFTQHNLGAAQLALGEAEAAAESFDAAMEIGLPWRMFWYQFGAFDAWLAVGRYDDVIAQAGRILADNPGVEELYYYTGRAYHMRGDVAQAIRYYELAIARSNSFSDAYAALAEADAALASRAG